MEEKVKDFEILLNKNIEFWENAKKEAEQNKDLNLHEYFCKGSFENAKHIKEIFESVFNKG